MFHYGLLVDGVIHIILVETETGLEQFICLLTGNCSELYITMHANIDASHMEYYHGMATIFSEIFFR